MDAIFTATPKDGKLHFGNTDDLYKYNIENDNIEQWVTMRPIGKLSEKQKLYAFLFGPLMKSAVDGYTAQGWEGVDKVTARYKLEAELCKCESYNAKTKKVEIYIESVAGMGKKRLLQFVVAACHFIETELQQQIPDSVAWKLKLETGKDMKQVI